MMPAAKHGDPQLGVDIHLCIVPPGATVPLPTPHMSVVFDPFDYIPFVGATTTVMGMKRATAGTAGIVVHIPPGFPFAKPPDTDDELFMGSSTVLVDGEPFSHISHPTLGCQVAGIPSPGRTKSKPKGICLLPTDFNLAIPSTVLIGGPPTISMMGLATKGAFKAIGALAKKAGPLIGKMASRFKAWRKAKFADMPAGFLKCVVLRAEPVDILSGAVSVEQQDFGLPGRLSLDWLRSYSSGNRHEGLCGIGWETPADARLEVDSASGMVALYYPGVGPLYFDRLPRVQGEAGAELELMDGARLADGGSHYAVRTKDDLIYSFPKAGRHTRADGTHELPLSLITDLSGNTLCFERQGGQLGAIVQPGGRRVDLRIEGGRLREVSISLPDTGSRHCLVRYEYDADGDLVAVIDALGKPYGFAYEAHRMVRHTDRNGLSFHYSYQQQGDDWRVDHAWGDGGLYDYRFAYFDAIHERRITDSLGHVSVIKLDENGLPINELDPLGGMTIFEYDDCGRTSAVIDPARRRTEYAYDERGNLLKLTRPDGNCVETTFNAANKPVRITDPNGASWQQSWDASGQLLSQISPLGHVSRYEYDNLGQLVAHINPRGARTGLAYDAYGNLVQIDNALGHRTRFAFDRLGNLGARSDPAGQLTRYQYDAKARLTAVVLPSGSSIHCAYDAEDNLTAYKDENGAVTRLEYFGQGEIARRLQPDGHTVEYLYDTEERLVGVRNQRQELYQLKRDALGRVVEEVDYWGQSRRYAYDAGGNLKATLDPLGQRIDYVTDPLGRIVQKILPQPGQPEGGAPWVEKFGYDANGNLLSTSNAHVEVTREFDAEGQLLKETQQHAGGDCFVIESAYDEVGNRVLRRTQFMGAHGPSPVSGGHSVDFTYDLLDQFIEARFDGGEPIRLIRDAIGQPTREELAPGLTRDLSYNVDGLLVGQRTRAAQQTLFATDYTYDPVGNLTQRKDSAFGADTYLYDPMGRILAHTDPQGRLQRFLNDPAGDRLVTRTEGQAAAGRDADWQRTGEYEGTRYSFNRAGNLTHRQDADALLELGWDANQRLIISRRTAPDGTAGVTRYAYDPLGRRLFKETAGQRTTFGWDGDALGLDAIDGLVREFVYRPESFEPLVMLGSGGAAQFHYINDPNGCPTRLIDPTGQVASASFTST
jgi:YD repeat-containing protein